MNKLLLVFIFSLLGFAACISNEQPTASNEPYIKSLYSAPVNLDPIKMNEEASLLFSQLVYEGLVRFGPTYEILPALAKSWSTDPQGQTLNFELDPKARFHNGKKVTATDVVASLTRNVSSESVVYKYYDLIEGAKDYKKGKATSVSGLKAVDKSTVQIKLEKPFPPFLYILAGATAKVFPAEVLKKEKPFENPVGAGAFEFLKFGKENGKITKIHLQRFGEYFRGPSKIKKLTIKIQPESEAHKDAEALRVHDLASWPLDASLEIFDHGQKISSAVANTWIVGMNTRLEPFNNMKTRKAFRASFNLEDFRKKFYPSARPAFGYIPPGFPGFKDKGNENNKVNLRTPSHNKITLYVPRELDQAEEMAKYIEAELKEKKWNVKAETLSWPEMMKRYKEKTMQAFLVGMNIDYPSSEFLLENFESNNPDNFSGISNKEIDKLLENARNTQDRQKRYKIYKRITSKLDEVAVTVNLLHPRNHAWLHPCVKGFEPNLLSTVYIDYHKVYLDSKCLKENKEVSQHG